MIERVFIALGSNYNPENSVKKALLLLQSRLKILAASTFYKSKAVGVCREGADFINGIIKVETELPPYRLKYEILRAVESAMGRKRGPDSCKSKIIDLDLLLYGDKELTGEGLRLPDPDIARFPFISVPLLELAPELVLPGSGARLDSLVNIEEERAALQSLKEFSLEVKEIFTPYIGKK